MARRLHRHEGHGLGLLLEPGVEHSEPGPVLADPQDLAVGPGLAVPAAGRAAAESSRPRARGRAGLSYAERKELDGLLDEIAALEAEKAELEKLFASASPKVEEMEKANRRYAEVLASIERKTLRWEELAARE